MALTYRKIRNCQGVELTKFVPVAGIVLASGTSTRFASRNKLLAPMGGSTLLNHTVDVYLQSALDPVLVVVGYDAVSVRSALSLFPVKLIDNPKYREGQSLALVSGLAAVPATSPGAVIGVADQPFLSVHLVNTLVSTFLDTGAALVAPRYAGRPGNPVLFGRAIFPELLEVRGDRGGREVVARHRDEVAWVEVDDARAGDDIDTYDDYRRLTSE